MAVVFQHVANKLTVRGELLSSISATNTGSWSRLDNLHPFTVSVEVNDGTWNGTVRLHVSDASNKPADSDAGTQLGTDITASRQVSFDAPYAWIKASVPTWVAGTVSRVGISGRQ